MDFSLRCSNFLHVLDSARMKHRATGLSNNNNHVYMAVALEAWQEVRQEGSKQASKRRKRLGDWRTHYTKDISNIKNTNFKNMLKGPSVGKTFTTTVRQVTPFYDWQTSFPHSAVTANAAAAEPKAVDEGKIGVEQGLVSASSVCVQLNSHSHSHLHLPRGCCGAWPFSFGARKYATIFLSSAAQAAKTHSSVISDRQTAPVFVCVYVCVCVHVCLCEWVCVSLGVLQSYLDCFFCHSTLAQRSLERIHLHANVSCHAPCPALCRVRAARITLLITKLNMNAFWYQTENREAAQT